MFAKAEFTNLNSTKKVRGVININAILSLNFEISRRLSSHLLSTLLHFRKENSVAFWTDVYPLSLTCEVEFQYLIKHLGVNRTSYDGNKYNLERKPIDYTIHYKSKEFIPDSYYEFNLKNTDHKQMMKNNLETENEISNDFNRRTRQAESGQPISEIKTEDDERAENLKLLLEEYNKDYDDTIFPEDVEDLKDITHDKLKELDNKYHKPVINKAVEDIAFDKNVNSMKKILKGKITNDEIINGKKIFYRLKNDNHKKEFNDGITNSIKKFNEDVLKSEKATKINENKKIPIKMPVKKRLIISSKLKKTTIHEPKQTEENIESKNIESKNKEDDDIYDTRTDIQKFTDEQRPGETDKRHKQRIQTNKRNRERALNKKTKDDRYRKSTQEYITQGYRK